MPALSPCRRAVPIISGDIAQDVIAGLADRAAGALAGRLGDDAGPGLALGYVEPLAELLMAGVVTTPEDPRG